MKRFKVLGLCMFAVFAFSAMLAASAQAAKEVGGPIDITSSGGPAHLGTEAGVELKSTNNEGMGKFESGTKGSAVTTFFNVVESGAEGKCTSENEPAGTVKTEPLTEELGWAGTLEGGLGKKGKELNLPGAAFKPAGSFDALFSCEGLGKVKVRNSVVGLITSPAPNVNGKIGTLALKGFAKFKQEPEELEGGSKDTLESSFEKVNGGTFTPSAQFQEDTTVNHGNASVCKVDPDNDGPEKCKAGETEINTLATGSPEIGRCVKLKGGQFGDKQCSTPPSKPGKGKYEFKPAEPGANAPGF